MYLRFKIDNDSLETLNTLKKETGLDDAGLITHALSLYNICWKEINKGRKICVVDEDTDILKELILNPNNE